MTGLRKLRILDSSRHNPAVGILYGSKPLGRLLRVGLSHYGSESEVKGAGFTQAVVGAVIDGKRIPYFLGDHPKAAIDDQVKSGHREKA
jgi:hypothetical protein